MPCPNLPQLKPSLPGKRLLAEELWYYLVLLERVPNGSLEFFSMMRLSSVSGTLVLNSIEHGRRSPFMNAMSSNGCIGSRVSWKAQRRRSDVINTDL
jgi:hypothetical protein